MQNINQNQFDHSWKYFEIHANQRMQMFNYYIAVTSALSAGLGATFQDGNTCYGLRIILGLLLIFVSFIFWKLDSRTSFLIKLAEVRLKEFEANFQTTECSIFTPEEIEMNQSSATKCHLFSIWSYSQAFNQMFIMISFLGFLGIASTINFRF